jgi:cytochrome P450
MTIATEALSPVQAAARERAFSLPLDEINPADPMLFADDTVGHYFERLRRDAPIHRSHSPMFGDYWSVTKYQDIMAVDTNHATYSSDWSRGGIVIADRPVGERLPDRYVRVLAFVKCEPHEHPHSIGFIGSLGLWSLDELHEPSAEITHWMPLPEPPG